RDPSIEIPAFGVRALLRRDDPGELVARLADLVAQAGQLRGRGVELLEPGTGGLAGDADLLEVLVRRGERRPLPLERLAGLVDGLAACRGPLERRQLGPQLREGAGIPGEVAPARLDAADGSRPAGQLERRLRLVAEGREPLARRAELLERLALVDRLAARRAGRRPGPGVRLELADPGLLEAALRPPCRDRLAQRPVDLLE